MRCVSIKTKIDKRDHYPFNALRWFVAVALTAGGIAANSIYAEISDLYRVLGLLVVALLALLVAFNTRQGAAIWVVLKEAKTEIRKVVWPSKKEINQTTLIIIVLVIIMAIILWLLDMFFGWLASLIIG